VSVKFRAHSTKAISQPCAFPLLCFSGSCSTPPSRSSLVSLPGLSVSCSHPCLSTTISGHLNLFPTHVFTTKKSSQPGIRAITHDSAQLEANSNPFDAPTQLLPTAPDNPPATLPAQLTNTFLPPESFYPQTGLLLRGFILRTTLFYSERQTISPGHLRLFRCPVAVIAWNTITAAKQ
jgi:hypothetical protein